MGKHIIIKEVENGLVLEVDFNTLAVFERDPASPELHLYKTIIRVAGLLNIHLPQSTSILKELDS